MCVCVCVCVVLLSSGFFVSLLCLPVECLLILFSCLSPEADMKRQFPVRLSIRADNKGFECRSLTPSIGLGHVPESYRLYRGPTYKKLCRASSMLFYVLRDGGDC